MSPREPLSPYFEAHSIAFHTWPFLGISFVDHRVGGFRKFPISSRCFLCPPASNFFLSICNKYTTSPETYRKYLARKWNIYYRFQYIGTSFTFSILNQNSRFFFPSTFSFLLLSRARVGGLTGSHFHSCFYIVNSTDRFPIPYLATSPTVDSQVGRLYIALPLFRDLQTSP
jgi:hypothetical protein